MTEVRDVSLYRHLAPTAPRSHFTHLSDASSALWLSTAWAAAQSCGCCAALDLNTALTATAAADEGR